MRNDYSTLEVVKVLGLTRERLRDWMNRGFIKPSVEAKGQGTKAEFTRQDIYKVALFSELINRGFKRDEAKGLISKMEQHKILNESMVVFKYTPLPKYGAENMNVSGLPHTAIFSLSSGELDADGKPTPPDWSFMWVINYKMIQETVDEALKTLE